jgi:GNAT superfamily N-acetyltransferase
VNIVEVNKDNVSAKGFFCYMSKRKTEGYRRKLHWLRERFDEGMKIKMLDLEQGGRGFIEYIPGESAWRAVNAEGYMFVHCIWVAGRSKGKGYGTLLLQECVQEAGESGMKGVAALASEGNWLVHSKFLLNHGFEPADQHPPFSLLVKKFSAHESPSLARDFSEMPARYKKGLTIVRSDQCPYVDASVQAALDAAGELGITASVVELRTSGDVRRLSPSPYGAFGLVYDGKLISYHGLARKELLRILAGGP